MMKCGVAVFDLPENGYARRSVMSLDSCWAAIAGQKARRLKSIHELATDVIWYTNISRDTFQALKLYNLPNLRHELWLRTRFAQITQELGLDERFITPDVLAESLAMITQNIINYSEDHFGVTSRSETLNADFSRVFNAPIPKLPPEIYDHFVPVVHHSIVIVIGGTGRSNSSTNLTVKPNRLEHARAVLSTQVPLDTNWKPCKEIPIKTDQWLESLHTPFLARISLKNIDPEMASLLSWGSGSQMPREWMTDVEWRVIRQFASIEIKEILINEKPGFTVPQFKLLPSGYFDSLSYSAGITAELLWTSLTTKINKNKNQSINYTAAAAWLRSADRMLMFNHAQKLYNMNCSIGLYGTGLVCLSYPEGGLAHYVKSSLESGLLPPMSQLQLLKSGTL